MIALDRSIRTILTLGLIFNNQICAATEEAVTGPQMTQQQEQVLTGEELKYLFLNTVSPINNSQQFFRETQASSPLIRSSYDDQITTNKDLMNMAREGQKFRNYYIAFLKEGFTGELLQWATDPDAAVYRELVRYSMREDIQNSEMPETLAARRAWRESLSRLHLPATLSYNHVIDGAKDNPNYENAIQLYQRLYLVYLDEITNMVSRKPFNFDEFLKRIESKITKAREANFKQAANLLMSIRKQPFVFLGISDSKSTYINIPDFSEASIKFTRDSAHKGKYRLKIENWYDWFTEIVNFYAISLKSFDVVEASSYFKTHFYQVSTPTHLVEIKTANKTIELSERNYSELLHQLLNKASVRNDTDSVWKSRYVLEASRRDVMLAETLSFLRRQKTNMGLELLIKSYLARMNKYRGKANIYSSSLTEQMRSFDEPLSEAEETAGNKLTDLRWAGYQVHPDFWRVRDAVSTKANGIKYSEVINNRGLSNKINFEEIQGTQDFVKTNKKEIKNKNYREGSNLKRSSQVTKFFTFLTSLTAALSWGTFHVLDTISSSLVSNKGQHELRMKNNDTHSNLSQKEAQKNGQLIFDVDPLKPNVSLPTNYNSLGMSNLPPQVKYEHINILGEEHPAVNQVHLELQDKQKADIKIVSHAPTTSYDGRVAILTPDHYRLRSLNVTDKDGKALLYDVDYKIYQVPTNGLYYFESSQIEYEVKYYYEATFSKEEAKPLPKTANFFSKKTLLKITDKLKSSGATQIPNAIFRELEYKTKLSLSEIESIFSQNSLYTYDKEASLQIISNNPFVFSTPYLRKDGVYYFQCTGSNHLLATFLEQAYREAGINSRIIVEQVNGFVLDNKDGFLSFPGHRRTLVADTKLENSFVFLDGTPVKMDPKYQGAADDHPLFWKLKRDNPYSPRDLGFLNKYVLAGRRPIEISEVTKATGDVDGAMTEYEYEDANDEFIAEKKKAEQKKYILDQARVLIGLKKDLREAVLTVISESKQTIGANTIHDSLKDLFYLIDTLSSFLLGKISKSTLLDDLIINKSKLRFSTEMMSVEQAHHLIEMRKKYFSIYGTEQNSNSNTELSSESTLEEKTIHNLIQEITDRFSQVLDRIAEQESQTNKIGHGYLLDDRVRWISLQILNILKDPSFKVNWLSEKSSAESPKDCDKLLNQSK
ncbi:MAG: hypothetical protein H6625_01600 [Bdellovibrionaceae bacterium]|nr:hypothetical protein [Pseudobdellovibrionaceae bacterium]